jgi:hypothetical protein
MPLAFLTLITGLAISAVAIYYSVIGLAAIFSAAVIPIIVMGSILEVSKLVSAWWLKANWYRAPFLLKSYMLVAVVVLMLITSMGIFGFLSKAHTDQAITSGDVSAQVYLIDEQIKVERENIANAQSLIKQLDDAVVGINASGIDREIRLRDGTTRTQSAAERALSVRRSQAKDRANLTKQIEEAQQKILTLQQKKAPIAAEMRKVEAEVGPIKYIAKLIYGDNPDNNILEKAVTWVIITIVFVFDPLAVLLLLASQMSFQWAREEKERNDELVQEETTQEKPREEISSAPESVVGTTDEGDRGEPPEIERLPDPDEGNKKIAEIEPEFVDPEVPEEPKFNEKDPLAEWNEMIAEAEKAAEEEAQKEEQDILDAAHGAEKAAMSRWKSENPNSSLKIQRRLLERGKIDKLPWDDYLKAKADEDLDALEAAKWAQEQLEKKNEITYIEKDGVEQIKKVGYKQNEEQSENTLWQRVKDNKK